MAVAIPRQHYLKVQVACPEQSPRGSYNSSCSYVLGHPGALDFSVPWGMTAVWISTALLARFVEDGDCLIVLAPQELPLWVSL